MWGFDLPGLLLKTFCEGCCSAHRHEGGVQLQKVTVTEAALCCPCSYIPAGAEALLQAWLCRGSFGLVRQSWQRNSFASTGSWRLCCCPCWRSCLGKLPWMVQFKGRQSNWCLGTKSNQGSRAGVRDQKHWITKQRLLCQVAHTRNVITHCLKCLHLCPPFECVFHIQAWMGWQVKYIEYNRA